VLTCCIQHLPVRYTATRANGTGFYSVAQCGVMFLMYAVHIMSTDIRLRSEIRLAYVENNVHNAVNVIITILYILKFQYF
jgi:hypothetical protein